MEPLGTIDPLAPGRPEPSEASRTALHEQRQQQAREAGYRQLAELCALGETEAAARLACRHPEWGYAAIAGEIYERLD